MLTSWSVRGAWRGFWIVIAPVPDRLNRTNPHETIPVTSNILSPNLRHCEEEEDYHLGQRQMDQAQHLVSSSSWGYLGNNRMEH